MLIIRSTLLLTLLLATLTLASCATPPTYAEIQATAAVNGCWSGNGATPFPITVTPVESSMPTSTLGPRTPQPTRDRRTPTDTRLPTTTPYPRCTPQPGETLVPYPTNLPTLPPNPTRVSANWSTGSDSADAMNLPGKLFSVNLAVHPTQGWAAVVAVTRFVESTDPMQVFVRVFNPRSGTWGIATQVDIGAASLGKDRWGDAAIGITGDGTVHVVWGASDGDQTGMWTSNSSDYGKTWSKPERIGGGCWDVRAMTASVDNQIVVLLACYPGVPAFLIRNGAGVWREETGDGTPGQFGSISIVGSGSDARAIAVTTQLKDLTNVTIWQKRLDDTGAWSHTNRPVRVPSERPTGVFLWRERAVTFTRPNGTVGILVMWVGYQSATVYAITSLDGGQTWGDVSLIAARDTGPRIEFVAPAYDPAADRLVAVWTCCGRSKLDSTHYASWSAPGSSQWFPTQVYSDTADTAAIPLVLSSRGAADTASAQGANSRLVWLAWIEQEHRLVTRSLTLDQVIPVDEYPAATPTMATSAEVNP